MFLSLRKLLIVRLNRPIKLRCLEFSVRNNSIESRKAFTISISLGLSFIRPPPRNEWGCTYHTAPLELRDYSDQHLDVDHLSRVARLSVIFRGHHVIESRELNLDG